jgi:hypothetical protein
MAVAWLLALIKTLPWGAAAAGPARALAPLLAVCAIQAATILCHTFTAAALFSGRW